MLFAAQTVQSGGDPTAAWRWIEQLGAWAADGSQRPEWRAAYARLAAECLEPCRDHRPPAATVAAVDDLQAVLLDADASTGWPAVDRAAYWQAVGEANRLVAGPDAERWVHIPAGEFWRGAAPGDDLADGDEEPAGVVQLSAYAIQRWPVLVREYAAFVDDGGYGAASASRPDWWAVEAWAWRCAEAIDAPHEWIAQRRARPTHPVTGVSFHEAMAYARWLTHTGRGPDGIDGEADLPTEAQWERAARGGGEAGQGRRYPWGWDDDPERRNGWRTGLRATNALGAFPGGLSADGLWAMSGNVWEWCRGRPRAAYAQEAEADPFVTEVGSPLRVLRGGGWDCVPRHLRVSYRLGHLAAVRWSLAGFRCVWRFPPRSIGG